MDHLSVIKIGGNVVDNPTALDDFLNKFVSFKGPKILVHGGGVMASNVLKSMGIEPIMVDGRRITDEPTLKVAVAVYAGWLNKMIVASLQAKGCNAIGLSGADCNLIQAAIRPKEPIDFGFVGDVTAVNGAVLQSFINQGLTPVLCAVSHDCMGNLLNTNADTIASCTAKAMANFFPTDLIFCFEKDGVLLDPDDNNSVISNIDKAKYLQLKEAGIISKGMIPKIDNAFAAIEASVSKVIIKNALNLNNDIQTTIA